MEPGRFDGIWDGWEDETSFILVIDGSRFHLNSRLDTNHGQWIYNHQGSVEVKGGQVTLVAHKRRRSSDPVYGPFAATWTGRLEDEDGGPPTPDSDPDFVALVFPGLGYFTREDRRTYNPDW